ncbi:SpoIIE family protein phosphatase [Magnetococcales bacterium HHB-1]
MQNRGDKQKAKILIVDNERFNINVLVDLLKADYEIMVAKSGLQTLKHVQSAKPPDLILLDTIMPEMDGYEVCRQLKADKSTREIPVIFVTDRRGTEDETKGLGLGAVDYIARPISPAIVKSRIDNHLALHRARQKLAKQNRELSNWQQQMQLLLRHTPSAIAMFDDQLRYMQVSHRWVDDYNLDKDNILGRHLLELTPTLSERWQEIYQKCLAGVWDKQEAELFFNETYGLPQYFTWEAFPWRTSSGDVGGVIMHTEDVTTRKRLEDEVKTQRDRLAVEKKIIEDIITQMRTYEQLDLRNLRILQNSVEKTTGDILLSDFRPDGTQHVLLGDFTGHGLPAAIGGPMALNIFYAMTRKCLPASAILTEINQKLYKQTPAYMFMTAGFLELNPARDRLTVWNCSNPDILIFRDGAIHQRVPSGCFARGMIDRLDKPGVELAVTPGDRVYMYTDGFIEETDEGGVMLGQKCFEEFLVEMVQKDRPLAFLKDALSRFHSSHEQSDDMTLVELTC